MFSEGSWYTCPGRSPLPPGFGHIPGKRPSLSTTVVGDITAPIFRGGMQAQAGARPGHAKSMSVTQRVAAERSRFYQLQTTLFPLTGLDANPVPEWNSVWVTSFPVCGDMAVVRALGPIESLPGARPSTE